MLGMRMVGALLVMVGMVAFLWGGVALLIEMDAVYSSIEPRTSGEASLLVPIGLGLTLAGGIALVLSSARRLA